MTTDIVSRLTEKHLRSIRRGVPDYDLQEAIQEIKRLRNKVDSLEEKIARNELGFYKG